MALKTSIFTILFKDFKPLIPLFFSIVKKNPLEAVKLVLMVQKIGL